MNRIRLILVIILSFTRAYSQSRYAFADSVASSVKADNFAELHHLLTKNLSSNDEKARAFYTWIALNILYDVHESQKQVKLPSKQTPANVFKSGKAICHGYSSLFMDLCIRSGIPCYLVSGYTRLDGVFDNTGHTWNIVYINNKWQPADVTWGAGGVDLRGKYIRAFTGKYFLSAPLDFLDDHYSFDPMWQLADYPVKLTSYRTKGWLYEASTTPFFNYNDTIAGWLQLDSLEREYASAMRMVRFNPGDKVMQEHLSQAVLMKGNAEFEKGNKIMEVLFPRKQTYGSKPATPESERYKSAQLDSIDIFYQKASACYQQAQSLNASDQAVLKSNLEALKFNREVVKREKSRSLK